MSERHPTHEPPITRMACVRLILGLGLIPVESAVRAALYGLDFAQQWRVADHWLRQITNGFVPGDRMPFAWLAVLLAAVFAGVLSAVARGAHPSRRADAAGVVTAHALVAVPLALWFGATNMKKLVSEGYL